MSTQCLGDSNTLSQQQSEHSPTVNSRHLFRSPGKMESLALSQLKHLSEFHEYPAAVNNWGTDDDDNHNSNGTLFDGGYSYGTGIEHQSLSLHHHNSIFDSSKQIVVYPQSNGGVGAVPPPAAHKSRRKSNKLKSTSIVAPNSSQNKSSQSLLAHSQDEQQQQQQQQLTKQQHNNQRKAASQSSHPTSTCSTSSTTTTPSTRSKSMADSNCIQSLKLLRDQLDDSPDKSANINATTTLELEDRTTNDDASSATVLSTNHSNHRSNCSQTAVGGSVVSTASSSCATSQSFKRIQNTSAGSSQKSQCKPPINRYRSFSTSTGPSNHNIGSSRESSQAQQQQQQQYQPNPSFSNLLSTNQNAQLASLHLQIKYPVSGYNIQGPALLPTSSTQLQQLLLLQQNSTTTLASSTTISAGTAPIGNVSSGYVLHKKVQRHQLHHHHHHHHYHAQPQLNLQPLAQEQLNSMSCYAVPTSMQSDSISITPKTNQQSQQQINIISAQVIPRPFSPLKHKQKSIHSGKGAGIISRESSNSEDSQIPSSKVSSAVQQLHVKLGNSASIQCSNSHSYHLHAASQAEASQREGNPSYLRSYQHCMNILKGQNPSCIEEEEVEDRGMADSDNEVRRQQFNNVIDDYRENNNNNEDEDDDDEKEVYNFELGSKLKKEKKHSKQQVAASSSLPTKGTSGTTYNNNNIALNAAAGLSQQSIPTESSASLPQKSFDGILINENALKSYVMKSMIQQSKQPLTNAAAIAAVSNMSQQASQFLPAAPQQQSSAAFKQRAHSKESLVKIRSSTIDVDRRQQSASYTIDHRYSDNHIRTINIASTASTSRSSSSTNSNSKSNNVHITNQNNNNNNNNPNNGNLENLSYRIRNSNSVHRLKDTQAPLNERSSNIPNQKTKINSWITIGSFERDKENELAIAQSSVASSSTLIPVQLRENKCRKNSSTAVQQSYTIGTGQNQQQAAYIGVSMQQSSIKSANPQIRNSQEFLSQIKQRNLPKIPRPNTQFVTKKLEFKSAD